MNDVNPQKAHSRSDLLVMLFLFFAVSLLGGMLGVLTLCILIWLSRKEFGIDLSDKHGISHRNSSRLGGLAVFVSAYLYYLVSSTIEPIGVPQYGYLHRALLGYEWIAILIGCVGLFEDLNRDISPLIRLFLLFLVATLGFALFPLYLPKEIDFGVYFLVIENPILIGLGSVVLLVGFTNAGNIADGANGLLAVILLSIFGVGFALTKNLIYWTLILSLLTFLLFNIMTGRIFLGDFGSYSFSSLAVLCSFDLYNSYSLSIWLFASILSYPCFEIVYSVLYRLVKNVEVYVADNNHLHNGLNRYFLEKGFGPLLSNSLTGVLIAAFFSVVPFLLAIIFPMTMDSSLWFFCFVLLCCSYIFLRLLLCRDNSTLA